MPSIPELLEYTLQKLDANQTQAVMIPLGALNSVVSLSAAEAPGTYRAIVCTGGVEMSQDIMSADGIRQTILPLLMKHDRMVQMQGILLAEQADRYLRAQAHARHRAEREDPEAQA